MTRDRILHTICSYLKLINYFSTITFFIVSNFVSYMIWIKFFFSKQNNRSYQFIAGNFVTFDQTINKVWLMIIIYYRLNWQHCN